MEDLRAISYGHAVSSLGYEVKVAKAEVSYRDGERHVIWSLKKDKTGRLLLLSKTLQIKRHGTGVHKPLALDAREARMIPQIVMKALKVLRIQGKFV